jgi:DNA end-binding protein Ku
MAARASWKGFLRISLVTCPVALYPATTTSDRISFNRIHRKTGQRVRQLNVDGKTGEKVEADDIVKGYEIDKGRYVLIEDEELEKIQVEASKIINVAQFVDQTEIEPAFLDSPYYLAPEGSVGEETYRVIRAAMEETGTAGVGSIVLSSRERRVLLTPKGPGIMLSTLRTAREVRRASDYFDAISDDAVDADLLDMAKLLIQARRKPFVSAEMVDTYEEEVRKLINSKAKGETPVFASAPSATGIVDLMAALKQSLEGEGGTERKPAARGKRPPAQKSAAQKPAGQKPAAAEKPAVAEKPSAAKRAAPRRKAS